MISLEKEIGLDRDELIGYVPSVSPVSTLFRSFAESMKSCIEEIWGSKMHEIEVAGIPFRSAPENRAASRKELMA